MRELKALQLHAKNLSASEDGAEIDLAQYIHVGGREMKAIASIIPTGADTDETCDYKLQESATTASSDFADITGATFTQVAQGATAALEEIHFQASERYIRGVATLAGTTPGFAVAAAVLAVKRASD